MLLAAAVTAFSFASCNKSEIETPLKDIEFDVTVSSPMGEGTKAVKTGWSSGDKIFIWFDDSRADTPNLTITYNGTKWEAGSLASGVVLDEEKGGSFKYIYLSNNTWFTSTPTHYTDNTSYNFPNFSKTGTDVERAESTIILCSNTPEFLGCPTYQFVDGKVKMVLDTWRFFTNAQVTVPIKEGIDAKYLRLRCIKGPNQSGAVHQLHIYDSYFNYGRLGGAYSVGQSATDGAVFYMFLYESYFTNNDDAINFELVDVSSGSKVHYKYTTSVSKVFPLSNGADIKDVEYPGGSALNAYGAVKVPVFNGAADSNWIEYIP